jgi:dihydroorotase
MKEIKISAPFDMHLHLREGQMLINVLPYTSAVFPRGVVMGNLPIPVDTAEKAIKYKSEILADDVTFNPIMTIMLTRNTTPAIIREAYNHGIKVIKYIPEGVSTNSEYGVPLNKLHEFYEVMETAEELGMILSGHWEAPFNINGNPIEELCREEEAIPFLAAIINCFPKLKIVVEHASTYGMIEYVKNAPNTVAATLTAHHALLDYSDVCDKTGKIIGSDLYCKPIAKKAIDRSAVLQTMISGNPKFFFGSDSAPHYAENKKRTPPAAGIFTAPVVMPLLCEIFDNNNALSKIENFTSRFGPKFYGLPLNEGKITVRREKWTVPYETNGIKIFLGRRELNWKVV